MLLCRVGFEIKNNESIFDFVCWPALIVFGCDLSWQYFYFYCMTKIPISFYCKGKHYEGYLCEVHGAAARMWHLMINNYYKGQLLVVNEKFVFHSNSGEMEDLAEQFGEQIILWYQ